MNLAQEESEAPVLEREIDQLRHYEEDPPPDIVVTQPRDIEFVDALKYVMMREPIEYEHIFYYQRLGGCMATHRQGTTADCYSNEFFSQTTCLSGNT